MRYILFLFVFVYSFSGISQVKYEKERRVKVEEVPSEALNFMQEFLPEKKVKWFYEEGTFGNSYETKFKKNGFKYSIELYSYYSFWYIGSCCSDSDSLRCISIFQPVFMEQNKKV